MTEPMIVITERVLDPRDACQRDHPMSFCPECGTWLHCKRDGIDLEYRRREEATHLQRLLEVLEDKP